MQELLSIIMAAGAIAVVLNIFLKRYQIPPIIGYLTSKAQRYQDSATLIAALGGGWWNNQPD